MVRAIRGQVAVEGEGQVTLEGQRKLRMMLCCDVVLPQEKTRQEKTVVVYYKTS